MRQLFDSTGTVTDTYSYDAFGNVVARTGTTANRMLYRSEEYDADLGFYYLRARWYNPQTGRFVTADVYEGDEEEPPSLHLYSYGYADPIQGMDPSGHANFISRSLTTISHTIRSLTSYTSRIAIRTWGQVQRGTEAATEWACCMSKAWSILGDATIWASTLSPDDNGLAMAAASVEAAKGALDAVCQLGCGGMSLKDVNGRKILEIDRTVEKWREAIDHILEAQGQGYGAGPLQWDPRFAGQRRTEHLRNEPAAPAGYDRDEWPPAAAWDRAKEPRTGKPGGAHVKPIKQAPNRSIGKCIGKKLKGLDGIMFAVRVIGG